MIIVKSGVSLRYSRLNLVDRSANRAWKKNGYTACHREENTTRIKYTCTYLYAQKRKDEKQPQVNGKKRQKMKEKKKEGKKGKEHRREKKRKDEKT